MKNHIKIWSVRDDCVRVAYDIGDDDKTSGMSTLQNRPMFDITWL